MSTTSSTGSPSFRLRRKHRNQKDDKEYKFAFRQDTATKIWIQHVSIFVCPIFRVIITIVPSHDSPSLSYPRSAGDSCPARNWSDDFHRRLDMTSYCQLRQKKSIYFGLYGILDSIVDQTNTVMDVLTEELMNLEDQVEQEQHHFQASKLRQVKQFVFKIPRVLKPAKEVLKNLMDNQPQIRNDDSTMVIYLRDVHDHLIQILDNNELQWQLCRNLMEDYREAKANQMNYVMYTLTIITTIFLPAQFLTGVYGMNFEYMPELHEKYGYYFFWLFVIMIAIGLQLYFRFKQWI